MVRIHAPEPISNNVVVQADVYACPGFHPGASSERAGVRLPSTMLFFQIPVRLTVGCRSLTPEDMGQHHDWVPILCNGIHENFVVGAEHAPLQ